MVPQEIDVALDELENRLDRLRSLYEQYFLGIEKIEPAVARKDVDRRFWILRRTQIRNTARRFRMQVLIQRYNTFQQYWARICREIENGTYTRHLLRVKKKFGEEPKTWAAKRRLGYFRRGVARGEGVDPDAETLSGESSPPPSFDDPSADRSDAITLSGETHSDFSRLKEDIEDLDLELDEPVAVPAPPAMARAAGQVSTTRFAGKPPPVSMPPLPLSSAPRPPPLVRKPDVPGKAPPPQVAARAAGSQPSASQAAASQGVASPSAVTRDAPVAPRPRLPSVTGIAPPAPPRLAIPQAPTAPRVPAASAPAPRSAAPEVPVARPAATAARPPAAPSVAKPKPAPALPVRPLPAGSAGPAPRPAAGASAATPAAPSAPNATRAPNPQVPARAPTAQPAQPAARAPLPATAPAAPPVARTPVARPVPAVAPPNPAASAGSAAMLSDDRLRQLHGELLATKQKLNQGNTVSLDALSKTLRETERKLREQHQGRSVDFHVVVKDGKPVVKPVVRK